MSEIWGFRSKYERAEFAEMANASLFELEALEKKYSDVLSWNEYVFSKNAEEEGHKIFSRLLAAVRTKISEVKSANESVKAESWKRRTALSTEVKGKKKERPSASSANAAEPLEKSREAERAQEPVMTKIPLAPEPRKPSPTNVKKTDLDGFAWGVRWAIKDMGDSASKLFGNSK